MAYSLKQLNDAIRSDPAAYAGDSPISFCSPDPPAPERPPPP